MELVLDQRQKDSFHDPPMHAFGSFWRGAGFPGLSPRETTVMTMVLMPIGRVSFRFYWAGSRCAQWGGALVGPMGWGSGPCGRIILVSIYQLSGSGGLRYGEESGKKPFILYHGALRHCLASYIDNHCHAP